MSQEKEKKIEENQNEEKKKKKKEEILIFSPENIDEIYEDINPLEKVSKLLESHHRKKYLNPNFDPEKILAKAEFHVNNLIFLKDKFPTFDNIEYNGILNAFAKLIDFDKYKRPENTNVKKKKENEEKEKKKKINKKSKEQNQKQKIYKNK